MARSAPNARDQFGTSVLKVSTESVELVKVCERNLGKPEKLGLSAEQAEEVHLLLRSSALGLLTVLSILSGHPDPREVIQKGQLP